MGLLWDDASQNPEAETLIDRVDKSAGSTAGGHHGGREKPARGALRGLEWGGGAGVVVARAGVKTMGRR